MSWWGWAANAVLFSGLWFVGNRLWWAFLLTIVGEVVWVVIAVNRHQYDLAAICAVFALLALRNLLKWRAQPTLRDVAYRLALHMNCHAADVSVWKWLMCEGVTGVPGVTPVDQFDRGEGHRVVEWLDREWGPPTRGSRPPR